VSHAPDAESSADVLVVEDRDALRTMLRLALESHGYRVVEARDQIEAESYLARLHPAVVITDLDHAWANVYVDEPIVPRLKLGQAVALHTDAGGPAIPGTVSYISPKAEFTPRNVQTAQDRSQLVYRLKVAVDNRTGVLKSGMPVEAELVFQS